MLSVGRDLRIIFEDKVFLNYWYDLLFNRIFLPSTPTPLQNKDLGRRFIQQNKINKHAYTHRNTQKILHETLTFLHNMNNLCLYKVFFFISISL